MTNEGFRNQTPNGSGGTKRIFQPLCNSIASSSAEFIRIRIRRQASRRGRLFTSAQVRSRVRFSPARIGSGTGTGTGFGFGSSDLHERRSVSHRAPRNHGDATRDSCSESSSLFVFRIELASRKQHNNRSARCSSGTVMIGAIGKDFRVRGRLVQNSCNSHQALSRSRPLFGK